MGVYEGRCRRQLVLNKGDHKYIFRYYDGDEEAVLDAMIDQAKDKRTDFDWFDAAVLSFKLTHHLIQQANDILTEDYPIHDRSI